MKAVTKLDVNLPRIVPVESAKGQAVIQLHAHVTDIERGDGKRIFLSKVFPEGKINRGVGGQVLAGILRVGHAIQAVGEAGTIVDIDGGERLPGESRAKAYV